MPYEPDPGEEADKEKQLEFRASREVRHTVIRVITAHLEDDAMVSWQGLNFDFTGVVFDGGNFYGANFPGGEVNFMRVEFSGGCVLFLDAKFFGGLVAFSYAKFSGDWVVFQDAEFSGSVVSFARARFDGGAISFVRAKFSGGKVSFFEAEFSGGAVYLHDAEFIGGQVSYEEVKFSGAGMAGPAGGVVPAVGSLSRGVMPPGKSWRQPVPFRADRDRGHRHARVGGARARPPDWSGRGPGLLLNR